MLKLILKHPGAVLGAILLHLVVIALFFLSFEWTKKPNAAEVGIPISIVSTDSLEPQANRIAEEISSEPSPDERLKEKAAEEQQAIEEKRLQDEKIAAENRKQEQLQAELQKKQEVLKLAALQAKKLKEETEAKELEQKQQRKKGA